MRRAFVLVVLVMAGLAVGCTAAQMSELHRATEVAKKAIDAAASSEGTIEDAEKALAALAPKTGAAHQAVLDAQSALAAWRNGKGTIDAVRAALAVVSSATTPQDALDR